ncbi:DUF2382 domain-containing protein [Streptomyces ficellus]|uniref:DUF2382 domain-containing protein n=1 Tax=Streptomyces ficellus TaxID=1977088 RepID=A0A6I6FEP8_9ACTN|nr:PRC and DUF2382 domain-containing protein [Streptomyces ficellus]QGV76959.1 DUF2382 domain-containing protein [Streptomyces ficellus]
MITQAQIPDVLDHPVYDATGDKIGEAKHVFVDDVTGRPDWVSVKTGFFGSGESFVPIHDASVVEDHLEVPYPKGKVKEAPNVDVDAGGHLSAVEERRLYEYYGIRWDGTLEGGDRSGDDDRARGTGTAAAGTAGAAGAAGAAGTVGAAGTAGDAGTARAAGGRTDDAMTRSEEEMHVGVEQRESGRARLRKYVVTEEVEQTVPLRHEEVVLEREPVTDANRDAALSGPEITESEHEVTLHAEEAVVETRATPVERVRLRAEEVTDEETVRGQVRKERIEAELPDDETPRDR